MTISTIGTSGRDYSTCKAWADAAAATLSAPWEGQSYNDGTITETGIIALDSTGDATNFMKLTTATGQSFMDHASKLTNALRPNQSNGVLVDITTHSSSAIALDSEYCIVEKIQVTDARANFEILHGGTLLSNYGTARHLLLRTTSVGGGGCALDIRRMNVVNCGIIFTADTVGISSTSGSAGKLSSCTIVNVSGASSKKAISNVLGAAPVVDNTATFNWGADNDAPAGSNNNATNRASFGGSSSSDQTSLTTTDQIESATSGSEDLRAKAAGVLDTNGVRDQTYTNDLDIVGQSRSTTTPTIGAWEVVAGGGGGAVPLLMQHYHGG